MCDVATDLRTDFLQCLHTNCSALSSKGRPVGNVALRSASISLTRGESGDGLLGVPSPFGAIIPCLIAEGESAGLRRTHHCFRRPLSWALSV